MSDEITNDFEDDEMFFGANEREAKRTHRQHLFNVRNSSDTIFDSIYCYKIWRTRIHVSFNRTLEARGLEIENQDHLHFSLLHQNEKRCY